MTFAKSHSSSRAPLNEEELYEYSIKALGRQMRTVAELKRLLRRKVESGEEGEHRIAAVVARLKEQRYLDDAAFASSFTRLRQENNSFGQRRVRQDLARKGVHRDLIATAVEGVYAGQSEEALLRRFVERKRMAQPKTEKESARVVRRLVAAGFSFPAIAALLKRWEIDLSEADLATGAEGDEALDPDAGE